MSITSKLYIDDDEFTILQYHWSFHQNSDITERPSARTTGGLITVLIETQKKDPFTEWVLTKEMMKNVKIVQSPTVRISKSRVLEFYDVYCLEASDSFNGVGNQPMTTTLVLSPGIIVVNGVNLMEKYWKVTDLNSEETPTQNNESNLISYYITDVNDEKTKEYDVGDTIFLYIETENSIGKTITLNLNDKTHDFKHNGIVLKNDILENHPINSNLEKVELLVIEPQN